MSGTVPFHYGGCLVGERLANARETIVQKESATNTRGGPVQMRRKEGEGSKAETSRRCPKGSYQSLRLPDRGIQDDGVFSTINQSMEVCHETCDVVIGRGGYGIWHWVSASGQSDE
jgi:hypothetical protein